MPRGEPTPLVPVVGGIRQDQVPALIDPTQHLWRSQNVVPRFGELRLRPGLRKVQLLGGPGGRGAGGVFYKTLGGTAVHVVASTTKWWKQSGSTWTDISGAVTLTGDADNPARFAVFPSGGVNLLLGVNNKDKPKQYNHSLAAFSDLTAAPDTARDITVAGGYVLLGNVVEAGVRSPFRVRASASNDPTTWPANFFWNLTSLGDEIVAIRRLGRTAFIVHNTESQWVGSPQAGTLPFTIELLEERPGPVSPSAIVSFGGAQYYLARDSRIYRANGVGVEAVSDPIDRLFQQDPTYAINGTLRQRAWGVYRRSGRAIWWVYPGLSQGDPSTAVRYDLRTGALDPHVFPVALTAGWPGDDIASVTWADLAGFTWTTLAQTYPTWASMGGTLTPIEFLLSSQGVAYRFVDDVDDDGVPLTAFWEYPLRAWLGADQLQTIDSVESSFEQQTGGPLVTVSVGKSEALAEPDFSLSYTPLTNLDSISALFGTVGHDTSSLLRQLLSAPNLLARFASIKYAVTTSGKVRFRGALLYDWGERAA